MNELSDMRSLFGAEGKIALVTGGSSGIGRMISESLAFAGARVLIASRKLDACSIAASEINAKGYSGCATAFVGDVSTEQGVAALADEVRRNAESLDILVNNAGTTWGEEFSAFPYEAWNKVLSINLSGPFRLIQELEPLLRKGATESEPARIINVGSTVGLSSISNNAYSYSASKAAIHHITKILAGELAAQNITVNAIAPGPFPSRMMAFATDDPDRRSLLTASVPLARLGRAADIAGVMCWLCGRSGSYVTGAVIPIDGGQSIK